MNQRTLSAEEVLELCGPDIEAMHNLQCLVVGQVKLSEPIEMYLRRVHHHLQHLADCLLPYRDSRKGSLRQRRATALHRFPDQEEEAMPDKAKEDIVGVDRLNHDQMLVEFSNNTVAVHSADDLAALPNER
jgi:hypothetical protein